MFHFQFVLLCLLWLFHSVQLFGVELKCPIFTEDVVEIVCKLNKTAIKHAECIDEQKYVTFDRMDRNKQSTALCHANNACDPARHLSPGTCCCDDTNQELKICRFSHTASRSYDEGARLKCEYCIEPKYLDVEDESCRNISFVNDATLTSPYCQQNITAVVRSSFPVTSSGAELVKGTPTWLIGVTFYIVCELVRIRLVTKGQS